MKFELAGSGFCPHGIHTDVYCRKCNWPIGNLK